MTSAAILILVVALFLTLLCIGVSVPFAIAIPSIAYLILYDGLNGLRGIGLVSWGSMNSFTLTAIPLFILMAEILQFGGLSDSVYRGMARLVGPVPGGLLQTNIAGCALFAAISGSSVATAAAIGRVALPELQRRHYSPRLSAGSLAAGGTLGILIPPSIAMIVYGAFTETSVAQLFMAGVIPGLLLTGIFMAYIGVRAIRRKDLAPHEIVPYTFKSIAVALGQIAPFVLLIFGTMGSIYGGLVTPTEAAAIGCILAYVIVKIWGRLPLSGLIAALRATIRTCGNILFIVYAAFLFSYAISYAGVGEELTQWLVNLKLNEVEFFVALFLLYTILGALVESLGMIVITVPLLYPVLQMYHIDLVWFGVILVLFVEMGQITPPIGINLFVIQGVWRGQFKDVVLGAIPFHVLMIILLILLVIFPSLALWLPNTTRMVG